jgi:hypothetical protein
VAFAAVVTVCLSVLSWQAAMPPEPAGPHSGFATRPGGSTAGDEARPASFSSLLASADPLGTYITRPLVGERILFILDGDMSIVDYIAPVALVTNAVIGTNASGERRVGAIMASGVDAPQLVWVESRDPGLAGACSVIGTALSPGRSNLAAAVRGAINVEASQVVVLFAKRIEADEIEELAEAAQQTGALVDLVLLGEARQLELDLNRVSEPTGGKVLALTDAELATWSLRVEQKLQADEQGEPR